jgi:predicted amidophosphoribosyltransferase
MKGQIVRACEKCGVPVDKDFAAGGFKYGEFGLILCRACFDKQVAIGETPSCEQCGAPILREGLCGTCKETSDEYLRENGCTPT